MEICKICNKEVKSRKAFATHFRMVHKDLNLEEYNNLYYKKEEIGDYECKMCNRLFTTKNGMIYHITHTHKISKKEYYDTYYKKTNDGICPVCGKETKFDIRGFGYYIHCSVKCINKNPKTIEKTENTKLKIYGVTNNTKLDYYKKLNSDIWGEKSKETLKEISNKSKQTCLEKYGEDNPAKLDIVKNKIKETCLEKYGVKCILESKSIREKCKKTLLEKYGVENIFQHPDIIEHIRKIMIDKGYSVDEKDYTKFKNYYKKCISLTQKNIRNCKFKENWNGYDYYDNEYIKDNYNLFQQNNENYPNIDHKISIIYGFLNKLTIEYISSVDNLCFTKRKHNASKNAKTENEYKKLL